MPAPSSSTPSSIVFGPALSATNSLAINSLLEGVEWGSFQDFSFFNPTRLTYSFPWTTNTTATFSGLGGGQYSTLDESSAQFRYGLTATQQTAAKNALQAWANVSKLSFTEVQDTSSNVGDIRFAFTSEKNLISEGSQAWGWAYSPGPKPSAGDVWISTLQSGAKNSDWSVGSYNYEALIHELGHALGLKHPFESSPTLPRNLDNKNYTIMSYTEGPNSLIVRITESNNSYQWESFYVSPDTPMLYDIAAIQYLYGANYSFNAEDTVYRFDSNKPFMRTIWDGGGKDTISVENFTKGCVINLNSGQFSKITIESVARNDINWNTAPPKATYDGTNNLAIAFNCTIENAIGGLGGDTLIGNSVSNQLRGNAGNDFLDGGAGIDKAIYSGLSREYLVSGIANNQLSVTDRINSRDGIDSLKSVERLKFTDINLALDIKSNENAGSVYMLYKAAFNRPSDTGGMGYWIAQRDGGANIVTGIAQGFVNSAEFISKYGANPSNSSYVNNLYQNVLGRAGEVGGVAYWTGEMDAGRVSKAQALVQFATLPEGAGIVAPLIANGIQYQEWFG